MLQGTKKQIPPITQSVNPAGPPATAFESLVMKKRMSTNNVVKSRVVSKPGSARSAYASDANALSDGRSSARGATSLADVRVDIYSSMDLVLPGNTLFPFSDILFCQA